ncbi:DUF2975 domain-containing protein [Stakelama tenebrarum]|uniref:DUF2975 domain-containing protein n=1 Tax=Stakelama tenebrarum TaxID=2711215 RepID=A0A6G6Y6F7_9SPHN|nr:DUF2975 domain-containing protein [Sphingosinithalassobacter tenebrarum]QIG80489.1 DUF2975 domain-containing protein [Sphingosinithalassobacter tenebrarum]
MTIEGLRARARVLMWLVTVPFVLLALLAVMQLTMVWRTGGAQAGYIVVNFAPMYVYVWAIWMVRQALKSIAQGGGFDAVVPKLLFRIGLALFCGALFQVFGTTLLSGLIFGRGPFAGFDGSEVTLGIVGATLVLVSQLLRQAAAMREELDAFF